MTTRHLTEHLSQRFQQSSLVGLHRTPRTRLRRAYMSYNRLESWNGHLAAALSLHVDVIACLMARHSQAGHPADADISWNLGVAQGDGAFYLGSPDQLFVGVSDLPMPTATWVDYFPQSGRKLLPSLRLFDVVFSSQRDSIPFLERSGVERVEWLPFAFDTTRGCNPQAPKLYDVGFVGSLEQPATRAERVEILGRLERKYRLNDYRVPASGDDVMPIYNRSRIVVNVPAEGGLNMRTFEALASGALLLTRPIGNGQDDLFSDGTHLVTYRDSDDLIDKIDYFLRHERERREIAEAGRREVLARHTYAHRAARVLEVMINTPRVRARDEQAKIAAYAAFYDYLGRADLLGRMAFGPRLRLGTRLRILVRAGSKFCRSVADFRRTGGVR